MKRRSRLIVSLLSFPIAILAAGCGSHDAKVEPRKGVHVKVEAAGKHDFTLRLRASGRIAPPTDRQASVSSPFAGRIQEVSAREGEVVKKGQLLARVDARPLEDAVLSAEAALKRAQADSTFKRNVARRSRDLFQKGVASRQEAESDESAAVSAESAAVEANSAMATARRNRSFAEITAPFDGVVVRIQKHPGEQVDGTGATAIVDVAGLHPLEVALDAPAEALTRIHEGDPAEVRSNAGEILPARVSRVSGSLDAASVVGGVRLRFQGADPALPLGSPVEVTLTLEKMAGAVSVQKRAVRRGVEGGPEVVLVVDGKAKATPVVTGPEEGSLIAILSGLTPGQIVVVEEPLGLEDGTLLEAAH